MKPFTQLRLVAFAALLLVAALPSRAQDPLQESTPSKPADATQSPDEPEAEQAPDLTAFGDLITGRWSLYGGTSLSQEYNDKVFNNPFFVRSDNISRMSGNLSVATQKKHFRIEANYATDYTLNSKYDQRNAFSQQFTTNLKFDFSGRTNLTISSSFNQASASSFRPYSLQLVNDVIEPIYNPDAPQLNSDVTALGTTFALKHSFNSRFEMTLTAGGNLVRIGARNSLTNTLLYRAQNYSSDGKIGLSYRVTPSTKIGVSLNESYLVLGQLNTHAHADSAEATLEHDFHDGWKVNIAVGPSFRLNQPTSGKQRLQNGISYNAGVNRKFRTWSFGGSVDHGNNLTGLNNSLSSTSASAFGSHQLWRHWELQGTFAYNLKDNYVGGGNSQLEAYSVSSGLSYAYSRNAHATFTHSYTNQAGFIPLV